MKKLGLITLCLVICESFLYSQTVRLGVINDDNCFSALPIAQNMDEIVNLEFNDLCTAGSSEFFMGFYAYEDWVMGLNMSLFSDNDYTYYEKTSLYGPFIAAYDACNNFSFTTPIAEDEFNDELQMDVFHNFNFTQTLDAGFYLLKVELCIIPNAFGGGGEIRFILSNDKDIACDGPCDDEPPCENPPCVVDPCDWYPYDCEPCESPPCDPDPCENTIVTTTEVIDCPTCIDRFAPTPGERYMFEGWVKEEGADASTINYDNPRIRLRFFDGMENSVGTDEVFTVGPIIEGWQQLSKAVTIPIDAVRMEMELYVDGSGNYAYFDDIRVSPFNSAMKTYVYDQQNMRLVAEMDERNFATFYQYDEEGRMIAVKKETERGIKTIQHIQQNTAASGN